MKKTTTRIKYGKAIIAVLATTFASSIQAAPPGGANGWRKLNGYSDEFNGSIKSFWRKDLYQSNGYVWPGAENVWFFSSAAKNISTTKNVLKITARKDFPRRGGVTRPWSTGGITHGGNPIKYGYFEARMKSAPGSLNSSFWLSDRPNNIHYELDVQESRGNGAFRGNTHRVNVHRHQGNVFHWNPTPVNTGDILNNAFHTYGVLWGANRLVFYYDNAARPGLVLRHNWFRTPLRLKLSLGIFGDVAETGRNPNNRPVDGGTMSVNWVRSWKRVR